MLRFNILILSIAFFLLACRTSTTCGQSDIPADLPPPFSSAMPPDVVHITFESNRLSRSALPFDYFCSAPSPGKGRPDSKIVFLTGQWKLSLSPEASLEFARDKWVDGEYFPFGGQIYQWRLNRNMKEGEFVRIPDHALAMPPSRAINVFQVGFDGILAFSSSDKNGVELSLNTEKGRRFDEKMGICTIQITTSQSKERKVKVQEVSNGDVIDTGTWKFRVERIVFPSKSKQIIGWVDLRYITETAK